MGDVCYARCITAPGSSLSSSDETCLSKCMDRYMDAFNVVAQSYDKRIRAEMAKGE
ncbi:mitochondrial import inner membrane translocase subunit Tim13-like protein [Catenaria anguillulae PL171]|uniref:Mitochondrial import inner membrane translocase subunit n=1 Tax=Catenaria anguillulae PL171 TaxID=765915 RepID=A0A1Y2HNK3_9FUNG|nr:mitochondrial import inner membrane translocase subunit Tim13-like protein [Catenaria anguillulae PL171]